MEFPVEEWGNEISCVDEPEFIVSQRSHVPSEDGLYQLHIENDAEDNMSEGITKYLLPLVCENTAELPPSHAPLVCAVGGVADAVSVLRFPELSAVIFAASNV